MRPRKVKPQKTVERDGRLYLNRSGHYYEIHRFSTQDGKDELLNPTAIAVDFQIDLLDCLERTKTR